VDAQGESCTIISTVRSVKYTIHMSDLMGTLYRSVFREKQGVSVMLNVVDERQLTKTDEMFVRLDVGGLPLVQAPVEGALDGET